MAGILIGDGNTDFLDNLRHDLGAEGYRVEASTRSCELLSKLLAQPFVTLILGTHLRGIDSPELIPIIHQIDEHLPIIAVGETPCIEVERKLRTHRIFYYLVKPVDTAELLTVVRQAISKRKSSSGGDHTSWPAASRRLTHRARYPRGLDHPAEIEE